MSVIKDIVDSQRLQQTADGFEAERSFIVDGLTGVGSSKLYAAVKTSGIPQFGEAHPSIPDITVTDITAEPVAKQPSQAIIVVVYSSPTNDDENEDTAENGKGKAVITSGLTSEQTHWDVHGNIIKASYASALNSISTNYSAVEVQRPQMRVTLTRKESTIPKNHLKNYLGKINSVEWSSFPPETWLCSGISVNEDGDKFDVNYSFEYREERWVGELVLPINTADAQTNPIDKDNGNGYALFDVYEKANFNDLGLSF